jgi:hypothetical protein
MYRNDDFCIMKLGKMFDSNGPREWSVWPLLYVRALVYILVIIYYCYYFVGTILSILAHTTWITMKLSDVCFNRKTS